MEDICGKANENLTEVVPIECIDESFRLRADTTSRTVERTELITGDLKHYGSKCVECRLNISKQRQTH